MKKTLKSGNIQDILSLTPMQEGMLFHYLKDPGSDYYFEQLCLEISGEINTEFFETAWNFVIDTNEMLRAAFRWEKVDNPVQIILKGHQFQPRYHDFSEKAANDVQNQLEEIKVKDREKKFDLREVPFRITLCKTEEKRYMLMISHHHILFDGWSHGIILKEFFNAYNELLNGNQLGIPTKVKFKEFIKWNQIQDIHCQEKFWQNYLKGFDTQTELSIKRKTGGKEINSPGKHRIRLNKKEKGKLEEFAKKQKVTLASLLYVGWGLLLRIYNNTDDVIFGTTVSGRSAKIDGVENIVGLFINTLPIRIVTDSDETIGELLIRLEESLQTREIYATTSLVNIKEYSEIDNKEELFDTIVVLENYPLERRLLQENSQLHLDAYSMFEMPHYDLTVGITVFRGLEFIFTYNQEVFADDSVVRMANHFLYLLQEIIENPREKISAVEIISEEEKIEVLNKFNRTDHDYPKDMTIVHLFEEQAEKTPDYIALIGMGSYLTGGRYQRQLTYRELKEKTREFGGLLRGKGFQRGNIAAIMVERSIETLIGIFGILNAGGVYLPIDPGYPLDRISYLLRDSAANVLFNAAAGGVPPLVDFDRDIINLEEFLHCKPILTSDCRPLPKSLAYVIYTSGSTGKPKGVMIEHRSVVNRLNWMQSCYPLGERDVLLQKTALTFDVSVWELFWWSFHGASLCLLGPHDELSPEAIIEAIEYSSVSVIHFVPSMLNIFLHYLVEFGDVQRLSSLRRVFSSGEALALHHAKGFYKTLGELLGVELINLYGPTETTVDVSYFNCSAAQIKPGNFETIPIGKPIDNIKLYVMNTYLQAKPMGIPGELCISGDGLARGYLNRPELTLEKFVKNPYEKGGLLYKTGDLAKWLKDGNIEFLGRIDHQVKIRGFRIELGEIENQLLSHDDIQEAVVTVKKDHNSENYLCGYIVSNKELALPDINAYLSQKLPGYMVPAFFVRLDAIPLTPSGKVDRRGFPAPGTAEATSGRIPPAGRMQKALAGIWAEVLEIDASRVGVEDDFFRSGGHSLKAMVLMGRIHKQLSAAVPLTRFFEAPTIKGLASYIGGAVESHHLAIAPAPKMDYYPVTPAQKRLFHLYRLAPDSLAYNLTGAITLAREKEPESGAGMRQRIQKILDKLIQRHESLRTSFETVDGEMVQRVRDEAGVTVEFTEIRTGGLEEFKQKFPRPFDLSAAPLLRAVVVTEINGGSHLLLDLHHIICDGISVAVLTNEFLALYRDGQFQLPPVKIQYKDFVQWRRDFQVPGARAYWLEHFKGEIPRLNLPTDYPSPPVMNFEGDHLEFEVDEPTTAALEKLAQDHDTTLFVVLLSLCFTWLCRLSGQEDIITGTPVAGRPHDDLWGVVGLFVNTLALRGWPVREKTFEQLLSEVRQTVTGALENGNFPFDELVDGLSLTREAGRNPLFDFMLVFQSQARAVENLDPAILYKNFHRSAKLDLTLSGVKIDGRLRLVLEYRQQLFNRDTVKRFAGYLTNLLAVIPGEAAQPLGRLPFISVEEQQQLLYGFNQPTTSYHAPDRQAPVHRLMEAQVEQTPDRRSVQQDDLTLTYAELNREANRLAGQLMKKGLKPGDFAAVIMPRSIPMITGIMAILKSGGAYIPIEPGCPGNRQEHMLKDAGVRLTLSWENIPPPGEGGNAENPGVEVSPRDPAYVIYTSGSTGTPKGVVVEHCGLTNYVCWAVGYYGSEGVGTSGMDFPLFTPYSFDLTVTSIFTPLISGGGIVIYRETAGEWPLEKIITDARVRIVKATPSHVKAIRDNIPGATAVKGLILGGEALETTFVEGIYRDFFGGVTIFNEYGPTEATVGCVVYKYIPGAPHSGAAMVPIGKPAANMRVYITEPWGRLANLQPVGVVGELCICGAGLARGYLNRPALTAEKFVKNPFPSEFNRRWPRLYRSGDLGRWLADGNIEFSGRVDEQVKIRGHRIEPGEIRHYLLKIHDIRDAVVIVRKEENRDPFLCAYVVARAALDIPSLKQSLSHQLPDYMIPLYFLKMESIPLTPNGKLDRLALPAPVPVDNGRYQAPADDTQDKIVKIWSEVLEIPSKGLGVNANFFEIGGNSLKINQVISKVRLVFNKEVSPVMLFEHPTIEAFSRHLTSLEKPCAVEAETVKTWGAEGRDRNTGRLRNRKQRMEGREDG